VHVVRSVIGLLILSSVPSLSDVIQQAPLEDKVMRMAEVSSTFTNYLKSRGLEYLENNKPRLILYGALTISCLIVDLCLLLFLFVILMYREMVMFDSKV
jgi:hypothetical protein